MRVLVVIGLFLALVTTRARAETAGDMAACRFGNPNDRIAGCTKIIAAEKGDTQRKGLAYTGRGSGYNDKGEFDKAIPDLNEAVRIATAHPPDNAIPLAFRAYSHFRRTDYGLARSDLDAALALKPDYASAYVLRGRVSEALRQYDRALTDYDEGIRRDPKYLNGYAQRASAYMAKRNTERAIADYRRVLELPAVNARDRQHHETARARVERYEKSRSAGAGQVDTRGAAPPSNTPSDVRRVALVIGNSTYANAGTLTNPRNDAGAVAAMLRRAGFKDVVELLDAGQAAMTEALKTFGDKAAGAEMAVVFFAGHGIELNGTSYLIPVDAKLLRDTHVPEEAVSLDRVQAKVDGATKLGLVILDACRNNPFAPRLQRSAGGTRSIAPPSPGLAPVEPEGNVLVAYAAKHGTVAEDGRGKNSPFTEALVARGEEPNLDIGILFRKVRDDVRAKTQRRQEPFVYGSLGGELLFLKAAAAQAQR